MEETKSEVRLERQGKTVLWGKGKDMCRGGKSTMSIYIPGTVSRYIYIMNFSLEKITMKWKKNCNKGKGRQKETMVFHSKIWFKMQLGDLVIL